MKRPYTAGNDLTPGLEWENLTYHQTPASNRRRHFEKGATQVDGPAARAHGGRGNERGEERHRKHEEEGRRRTSLRPVPRPGDIVPVGALRRPIYEGGARQGRGYLADLQRERQRPDAEGAGGSVPRQRREGPGRGCARRRVRLGDREGSAREGRPLDRLRPPDEGRRGEDLRLVRRSGRGRPAG